MCHLQDGIATPHHDPMLPILSEHLQSCQGSTIFAELQECTQGHCMLVMQVVSPSVTAAKGRASSWSLAQGRLMLELMQ